ncbi:MAG: hypothetical protein IIA67_00605 [Planctomycetes bacterium]|nr:hypothetical protein [Planctomycetota bacterium]
MSDAHRPSRSGVPPLSGDFATQSHQETRQDAASNLPAKPLVAAESARPVPPLSGVRPPRFPLRGLLLFVGGFSVLCALASATGMSLTEALIGLGVVSFVALATAAAISLGYPPDGTPPPNGD